ncbi:MAG: hypothetical protein ACI4RB_00595 [Acutalibacteraceae bacterium]
MSKHYYETMVNGENFYKNAKHNYTAKMMDGGGFTARIDTSDRTYYVITRVDDDAELVIMEIAPCIFCSEGARSQVGEYIDKINAKYKSCNLRIAHNGNLHIHAEQRFDDGPLSVEMFRTLESECIKILDTFEIVLDKLAHLKLIEPDEADVEKMIDNHRAKFLKRMVDSVPEILSDDDDDDDNASTVRDLHRLTGLLHKRRKDPLFLPADDEDEYFDEDDYEDDSDDEDDSENEADESDSSKSSCIGDLLRTLIAVSDMKEGGSESEDNDEDDEDDDDDDET